MLLSFYKQLYKVYVDKFDSNHLKDLKTHIQNNDVIESIPELDQKIKFSLTQRYISRYKSK